ncbi:MAG: efflux RND transporter periplasmic adaptor subunit [Candidatus Omnitrophota bacterium]
MKKRRIIIALGVVLILVILLVWHILKIKETTEREEREKENATPEVSVHVGKIRKATLHRFVIAYGVVEPPMKSLNLTGAVSHVASTFSGILARVHCYEGQRVKRGKLLFSLDRRLADLQIEKAKQAVSFAKTAVERQQALLAAGGTSQKNVAEAEQQYTNAQNELANAQAQAQLLEIRAPIDGTITRIYVQPGEAVETAKTLADIVNLEKLEVTARVPSQEVSQLQLGQVVEIGEGEAKESGKLIFIGSEVDPRSDTVLIRASLPNATPHKPGQFLTIRIISAVHPNCLTIPETGLVRNEQGKPAIMQVKNGMAIQKVVDVGLTEGGRVEIRGDGLTEGMPVVTEGAYGLPDQTKIIIVSDDDNDTKH